MKVAPVFASVSMMEFMVFYLSCSLIVTLLEAPLIRAAIALLVSVFKGQAIELGATSVEVGCTFWSLMIGIPLSISFASSTTMERS